MGPIRRRLAAAVAAAALAVGFLGVTPAVRADVQACSGVPDRNIFAAKDDTWINQGVAITGIFAHMDTGLAFGPCAFPILTTNNVGFATGWIDVQDDLASAAEILQVGIIDCNQDQTTEPIDACWSHPNSRRYFFALAGCAGSGGNAYPYPRDLGPADNFEHSYQLWHSTTDSKWHIKINNTEVTGTFGLDHVPLPLPDSHPIISCWLHDLDTGNGGRLGWWWATERTDYSDSLGNSANPFTFSHTEVRGVDNVWRNQTWSGCTRNDNAYPGGDSHCTTVPDPSGTILKVWDD